MKRNTFIDFYLDTEAEDLGYIDEYLRERGIDIEKAKEEILSRVRKNRAQQKIDSGKEFVRKYAQLMSNPQKLKEIETQLEKDGSAVPELRLAFRKLEAVSADDIADILSAQEKLAIIEYIKHQENSNEISPQRDEPER
jgi:hypothetical protein